eukprot:Nitzschia sp. Nitz4//scaffold13_size275219//40925//41728//NITZ4_000845-RA/size275219-processed-gene-0.128-mRNA-1//-1//CDS//3329535927//2362//frame0
MPAWWSEPTSKHAFILSWFSVVLTALAVVGGLVTFNITDSALCLVFGLENIVDFLSSVVVLWRFYCPGEVTKEREDFLHKREKRASMAISFIMVLLGLGVMASAGDDLATGPEGDSDLSYVAAVSFISIFVFGGLTLIKFRYANKLSSASLYKDGQCSLIGTVLSIGLLVTTLIVEQDSGIWWLDPVFALICGFVALVLGVHAIVVASCFQGLPIFTMQWWFISQGDGMDEMAGRELEPSDFGEATATAGTVEIPETKDETNLSEVV